MEQQPVIHVEHSIVDVSMPRERSSVPTMKPVIYSTEARHRPSVQSADTSYASLQECPRMPLK